MQKQTLTWNPVRDVWETQDDQGNLFCEHLDVYLEYLATLGYDAQWRVVSASQVGAPHRRDRVFVLAHRRDRYRINLDAPSNPTGGGI